MRPIRWMLLVATDAAHAASLRRRGPTANGTPVLQKGELLSAFWRDLLVGGSVRVFLACFASKRTSRSVQPMPCRRLCVGALAMRRLCIIARRLARPKEEQGDQCDDWRNAGDGKAGIIRMGPVHDLSEHRLHR